MVLALPARTKRLVLRRFEPQDVEIFFGYRNDPAVARFQSWDGIARSAALHFVRGQGADNAAAPGEWFQIALALAHSNQLVGDVGVCIGKDGRAAELGFTLARAHQKFGYAAEGVRCVAELLFAVPAIGCVTAVIDARNLSARKLLDRLGFQHTATAQRLFKGTQCAEYTFEILRAAWRGVPASRQPARPPDQGL